MNSVQPATSPPHLAYDDLDAADQMAHDASVCRGEAHLARALSTLAVARRTVETMPGTRLQAPAAVTRTALGVTEQAARFAARLLD